MKVKTNFILTISPLSSDHHPASLASSLLWTCQGGWLGGPTLGLLQLLKVGSLQELMIAFPR